MQNQLDKVLSTMCDSQQLVLDQLQLCDLHLTMSDDSWRRDEKSVLRGSGRTVAIKSGDIFEGGGINFSRVMGDKLPKAATKKRQDLSGNDFVATGVSVVLHPLNPFVPTSHCNIRFFQTTTQCGRPVWWFGGGFDLTPTYGFQEDCILWHQAAQVACEQLDGSCYSRYKSWCDDYFYLPHRDEPRGIGGIFFDDLNEYTFELCLQFCQHVMKRYIETLMTIVKRRNKLPYSKAEREFQCYRRGRYVEFNLLQDRGTLFGLQSGGRTESILVSMPPKVSWEYRRPIKAGSKEEILYRDFLKAKDWLAIADDHGKIDKSKN